MVQGVAQQILHRVIVPDLAGLGPEADLLVACQHRLERGPIGNAKGARAATQYRWTTGELFRRASGRISFIVGVIVNGGPSELYLPEQQHIIND